MIPSCMLLTVPSGVGFVVLRLVVDRSLFQLLQQLQSFLQVGDSERALKSRMTCRPNELPPLSQHVQLKLTNAVKTHRF